MKAHRVVDDRNPAMVSRETVAKSPVDWMEKVLDIIDRKK